jgi:hypothetical protein
VYSAKGENSLRRLSSNAIGRAFAISVLIHFLFVGVLEFGRQMGWWKHSFLPKSLRTDIYQDIVKAAEERRKQQLQQQQQQPETQLVFVDVDPSQASPEPPKQAKYYSSQNTLASNPNTQFERLNPEIKGKQEQVPKTSDNTLRPDPTPAPPKAREQNNLKIIKPENKTQPAPPQQNEQKTELKPKPKRTEEPPVKQEKGDLLVARAAPPAQPQPKPQPQESSKPRPRTLAEARAQKGLPPGEKMKMEGGTRRFSMDSNLDVKATPFGSYDAAFIAAVRQRWYSLLDQRDYVGNSAGKVTLEFRLNKDGRILDMRVAESTVPEFLEWMCQRAVLDPAPYMPFPPDMRKMYNSDSRPIRFTFYYNQ